jgi:hypothetical protein
VPVKVIQLNKYWTALTMSEVNLEKLREHGLLPYTFQIMTFTVFLVKSSSKGFAEKWFYIDLREKNVIKADYRMPITIEA